MSKYGVISGPYFPAFGLNTDQKLIRIWTLFTQWFDFDRILKIEKRIFVESRAFKRERERNCYMLFMNRRLVEFLRRGKVNVVEYWWNIVAKLAKGEQVITLQMAQQLKTENINVVPGQLFSTICNYLATITPSV